MYGCSRYLLLYLCTTVYPLSIIYSITVFIIHYTEHPDYCTRTGTCASMYPIGNALSTMQSIWMKRGHSGSSQDITLHIFVIHDQSHPSPLLPVLVSLSITSVLFAGVSDRRCGEEKKRKEKRKKKAKRKKLAGANMGHPKPHRVASALPGDCLSRPPLPRCSPGASSSTLISNVWLILYCIVPRHGQHTTVSPRTTLPVSSTLTFDTIALGQLKKQPSAFSPCFPLPRISPSPDPRYDDTIRSRTQPRLLGRCAASPTATSGET